MNQKMNQLLDGQPPTGPRFTEKTGQDLAFTWAYSHNGRSSAERDMQHYFGVAAFRCTDFGTLLKILTSLPCQHRW
ncbi:hypothetical protein [Mesorhizobium sp.]|uniref:hypothetical protein n=1 Tax=Mesorhizobium sp. TaxID=1871066 RepID=UPI0025D43705|nr:hypothetical protein [Mesorhizobium sp.]